MTRVAAVVLGRNEGPRLPRCLRSLMGAFAPIVYVDSESSDGSPETARALGVDVLPLSLAVPFTFGRGRNAGVARVLELDADVELIQFVDSDSEIVASWPARAVDALVRHPEAAVTWGHVRERNPGVSLYDRLYDVGFRAAGLDVFGGMSMMRVSAYLQVGRFNEAMRGYEDHELAFRLQRAGWKLQPLDTDMAMHEAGMTRFREWWRHEHRAGHSRAHQIALHGRASERAWLRAYASILAWGLVLPALALGAAWPTHGASLLLLAGYPLLGTRIYLRMRRRGLSPADAALFAGGRVAGKFGQLQGLLSFYRSPEAGQRG